MTGSARDRQARDVRQRADEPPGRATSPYLRQHAANPVDWWEWGAAAIAAGAQAGCADSALGRVRGMLHWCHVMAHESFADEATAALINTQTFELLSRPPRERNPSLAKHLPGAG